MCFRPLALREWRLFPNHSYYANNGTREQELSTATTVKRRRLYFKLLYLFVTFHKTNKHLDICFIIDCFGILWQIPINIIYLRNAYYLLYVLLR